ncbi:MAG: SGNH/GDSL hydrolase family protein [Tetrasphaera sp.]
MLPQSRRNLEFTIAQIHHLQQPADARVALLGYWNVFRDGAVGRGRGHIYVAISDSLTREVNDVIADVARRTGALYVDAFTPFKGNGSLDPTGALAGDGNHPNAAGHRLIADAVLEALGVGAAKR